MLIRAFNACVRLPIFTWYFSAEREQGSSLFVSATTSIIKKHQFVIVEAEKIKAIEKSSHEEKRGRSPPALPFFLAAAGGMSWAPEQFLCLITCSRDAQ